MNLNILSFYLQNYDIIWRSLYICIAIFAILMISINLEAPSLLIFSTSTGCPISNHFTFIIAKIKIIFRIAINLFEIFEKIQIEPHYTNHLTTFQKVHLVMGHPVSFLTQIIYALIFQKKKSIQMIVKKTPLWPPKASFHHPLLPSRLWPKVHLWKICIPNTRLNIKLH